MSTPWEYFRQWRMAIESGLFDVMAHPDYWRRFLHLVRAEETSFLDYRGAEEAIDSLISYGVGIEVNSSGRRHHHGQQYPVEDFLEAAWRAGLRKVTIGSDSHTPEHLGYWLPEALDLLRAIGFKHISRYRGRREKAYPIDSAIVNALDNRS